jgi:hypothetical protein
MGREETSTIDIKRDKPVILDDLSDEIISNKVKQKLERKS